MDVGAYLRDARERRGLTLEQVANSTKLSTLVLQLIERNEWARLPGGLVTRGHLRAYAAEVKVSPEDVVHEYLAQLPSPTDQQAPIPRQPTIPRPRLTTPVLTAVVGIVVAVGMYMWPGRAPAPLAPASDAVRLPPPRESPVLDDTSEAAPATKPESLRLSLAIDAMGPCWVSARADGRLVVYRLLEAGESVTVAADEQLMLRVGDAGVFRYTLNGLPGRPLGDAGEPVTVAITRHNVQTFVASSTPVRWRS